MFLARNEVLVERSDWERVVKRTFEGRCHHDRLKVCINNAKWMLEKIHVSTSERDFLKSLLDICEQNNWH